MDNPNYIDPAKKGKSDHKADQDVERLKEALDDIDSMCQIQLDQIQSVVNVMFRAMETPAFWGAPTLLQDLLALVQYLAGDLQNYVNAAAENVGCNHIDKAERARSGRVSAAFHEARNCEVCHG